MLRKIRITLAIITFTLITVMFLDFTGTLHAWFGWLAKIQFLPALLALNFVVVVALIVLTLIFGRIYCSVICPLGVFQDCVSAVNNRREKKNRFRFKWSESWGIVRPLILLIFGAVICYGATSLAGIIAPYSAWGRIVTNLFAPIYQFGNNILAFFAERVDSYAFYSTDVWIKSIPTFIVAALTFIIISVLAWKNGRVYCNTICPVGTVLGIISKYSFFKIQIDTEKCNGCKLCGKGCKASCINTEEHYVDHSRCVMCMDCINNCKQGAISYKPAYKLFAKVTPEEEAAAAEVHANRGRRNFIIASAIATSSATLKAQELKVDGGLAAVKQKKPLKRDTPLKPAGSVSLRNFSNNCTACQLCVSACPNGVLRPSTDLATFMQPEMSFERGYCRPECSKCSEVCPAGAILKISAPEKTAIKIGTAIPVHKNCIVHTDDVKCGNCARHCPSGAIKMVENRGGLRHPDGSIRMVPIVNEELCIGCGACENLCPAQPFSAIHVEGIQVHRNI